MAPIDIGPALEPEEWRRRLAYGISVRRIHGEVHLVVQDPDGEVVTVTGASQLFALVALALDALNQTLSEADPRRLTHDRPQLWRLVATQLETIAEHFRPDDAELEGHLRAAAELRRAAAFIEALLPPEEETLRY